MMNHLFNRKLHILILSPFILITSSKISLCQLPSPDTKILIEFVHIQGGEIKLLKGAWSNRYDTLSADMRCRISRGINHYDCINNIYKFDDFYISKYEITNCQYAVFLNDFGKDEVNLGGAITKLVEPLPLGLKKNNNKWISQQGKENHPVVGVNLIGMEKFCEFYGFKLPTMEEWLYAAFRGKDEKWSETSDKEELKKFAWFKDNSGNKTHPVGSKKPNINGLYDMFGNVWEWCIFNHYNPHAPNSVQLGGGWNYIPSEFQIKAWNNPRAHSDSVGFRVVTTNPKIVSLYSKNEAWCKMNEISIASTNNIEDLNGRAIKSPKIITLKNKNISIHIYDRKREDGDIISLFYNGKWILNSYSLTKKKKLITLKIEAYKENSLILYANSEGELPPCTVGIEILDNNTKQSINLESDLKKCDEIKFQLDR
jgi:sulfatase-modifying factor enzyme 1